VNDQKSRVMPEKVIIWGAAGHAKIVCNILRLTGLEVAGFIDDLDPSQRGDSFYGATVLGDASELNALLDLGFRQAIVGFGDNIRRLAAAKVLDSLGFKLISAIHPSATLASDLSIGNGSVFVAGCVVNTSTLIGRCVILNTNATLDHDCIVEDGVHVGPGANIAGHVKIGRGATIGIGATVLDHICIGAGSIIGAGAVVLHDVPENVVAVGVPARVIRQII
jgi:sugar O-acyltransferase (sialic acid O-acetyltransferase NeuD family)